MALGSALGWGDGAGVRGSRSGFALGLAPGWEDGTGVRGLGLALELTPGSGDGAEITRLGSGSGIVGLAPGLALGSGDSICAPTVPVPLDYTVVTLVTLW